MSKLKSLSLYALALAFMPHGSPNGMYHNPAEPKESEEDRKARIAATEKKLRLSQGLSEFFYGQNSLWALNQKSADRKAKKRGWL